MFLVLHCFMICVFVFRRAWWLGVICRCCVTPVQVLLFVLCVVVVDRNMLMYVGAVAMWWNVFSLRRCVYVALAVVVVLVFLLLRVF